MVQEEIRKGPWTEQEDILLVNFVHLFGDRRWDFIATVSGLNRTGKSCRLRWVNYLHPGLKRGKMTPQEEKLVLDLHSKWGNRWSRIARRLPGRTDNEIKNYWRTHTRKKAQERKKTKSPSSSSSNCCPSCVTTGNTSSFPKTGEASFYDTGGPDLSTFAGKNSEEVEEGEQGYSMDDIWNDIALSEENAIKPVCEEGCNFSGLSMASPSWGYFADMAWRMEEDESKIFLPSDQFLPCYEYGREFLTL